MKEAEAIAISVVYGLTPATTDKQEVIDLTEEIKAYGKQCAEKALKDAADNMNKECEDFGGLHHSMKNVIISTPITTP